MRARHSGIATVSCRLARLSLIGALVIMVLSLPLAPVSQASSTSYHIGNSLTWNSQPNGLAALATANGRDHAVGYHIHSGWSLTAIWNNPDEITLTNNFGGFTTALPNNAWDYVTLQPHHSNTTLASDTQRILDFIHLTRAGPSTATEYYIYAAWPRQPGDYKALWTQAVSDTPDQPTVHARAYFDLLHTAVTSALGDTVAVHVIPVGEVLYRVDLLFESGIVPGFTDVSQLYRDENHLDNDIGGWIAANTVYATIFRENPVGLKKPDGFYLPSSGETSKLSELLSARLQSIVWEVVSSHPASGIDITPGPFSFNDENGVDVGTVRISNTILVTDINAPAAISIANGEYAINSEAFTALNGSVNAADRVAVRLTSPAVYSATTGATLTIGGVSDTFNVTTLDDVTPEAFSFGDQQGVPWNASVTSNPILVDGITAPAVIAITGGMYSINGGSYTVVDGLVDAGDRVTVQVIAPRAYAASVDATLTIGGISDTFTVTTLSLEGVDSNDDGINDTNAAHLGLDPRVPDGDTDRDGVPDRVELGTDASGPADSDGDGIIDALETGSHGADPSVLGFYVPLTTAQALGLDERVSNEMAISAADGAALTAHSNGTTGLPLYGQADMPVSDEGYTYLYGLIDFTVATTDGNATVIIQLPGAISIPDNAVVRKLDVNKQWHTYTEAFLDRNNRTLRLELRDNDRFDTDFEVGLIRDPVGIAIPVAQPADGAGGGCTISNRTGARCVDLSLVLILALSLFQARRRSSVILFAP